MKCTNIPFTPSPRESPFPYLTDGQVQTDRQPHTLERGSSSSKKCIRLTASPHHTVIIVMSEHTFHQLVNHMFSPGTGMSTMGRNLFIQMEPEKQTAELESVAVCVCMCLWCITCNVPNVQDTSISVWGFLLFQMSLFLIFHTDTLAIWCTRLGGSCLR